MDVKIYCELVLPLIIYFCLTRLYVTKQNYNAKISDSELATNGPDAGESHVSTRVMGTYGYAAPEYITTGKVDHAFYVR